MKILLLATAVGFALLFGAGALQARAGGEAAPGAAARPFAAPVDADRA